jgi:hypothetical protein
MFWVVLVVEVVVVVRVMDALGGGESFVEDMLKVFVVVVVVVV